MYKSRSILVLAGAVALAAAAGIWFLTAPRRALAAQPNTNSGVLPPQSSPYGKTYGAWGAVPVFFRARVRDSQGKYSNWSPSFVSFAVLTDVKQGRSARGKDIPPEFSLGLNYPNPFNPTTTICYGVSVSGSVRIVIYDILGREIAVLVNGPKAAGGHQVMFDGTGISSGVYICRMTAGRFAGYTKMVLAK